MKQDKWIEKWEVDSKTTPGKKYIVARDKNWNFGCTCPAWKFKRKECWHIRAVKEQIMVYS